MPDRYPTKGPNMTTHPRRIDAPADTVQAVRNAHMCEVAGHVWIDGYADADLDTLVKVCDRCDTVKGAATVTGTVATTVAVSVAIAEVLISAGLDEAAAVAIAADAAMAYSGARRA